VPQARLTIPEPQLRYRSVLVGVGLAFGVRADQRYVVDGEGPFPADIAGEREPPAEDRADPVA
jgi:hypothetical protein